MSAKVDTFIKNICVTTGEGPHWDESNQTLLFVDMEDGSVHRYSTTTCIDEKFKFEATCSLVVPCKTGGYIVSIGKSICHFNWDTKLVTTLHTVDEGLGTIINDGKCDSSGRLWFGTMGLGTEPAVVEENQGSLYSLELDGSLRQRKEGVSISNGLAWTDDDRTMYYIDSIPRKVFAYDFDITTGNMSNEHVVVDFGGKDTIDRLGYPDGMAIDNQGKLWVATYFGGRVVRFDPETGKEMSAVSLPSKRITSCCFGGQNLDELFITCSADGLSEEESKLTPLAGSIFRATSLGVKGAPAPVYLGQLV